MELSVRTNLLVHADVHGLSRRVARERVFAAVARFGLSDRAVDRARTLSRGNRRRMDEATVGLDPASRRDILSEMVRLKEKERIGVLWTTHLVDEVEHADRLVVRRDGQILFDGTVRGLLDREGSDDLEATVIRIMGEPSSLSGAGRSLRLNRHSPHPQHSCGEDGVQERVFSTHKVR